MLRLLRLCTSERARVEEIEARRRGRRRCTATPKHVEARTAKRIRGCAYRPRLLLLLLGLGLLCGAAE